MTKKETSTLNKIVKMDSSATNIQPSYKLVDSESLEDEVYSLPQIESVLADSAIKALV